MTGHQSGQGQCLATLQQETPQLVLRMVNLHSRMQWRRPLAVSCSKGPAAISNS